MRGRFDYGGIETATNGLTSWLQERIKFYGNSNDRYQEACKIIVDYGEANIPHFIRHGHVTAMADYVARKVHKNKKFQHFAKWVIENKMNQPT